jgi:ubiquinone/menaquinone biosynthesis C-methylase UbiE
VHRSFADEAHIETGRFGMKRLLLGAAAILALAAAGCTDLKRFAYDGFGRRDRWQHSERVIRELGLREGDRVADLGAGGGYFTFRLAEAVGPAGEVYAVDVDQGMIGYLEERAAAEGRTNVKTIVANHDDPLLPPHGVDLIFTSNTYHHLEDRAAYFRRAGRYLRPGGRVAIIDFTGSGSGPAALLQRLFGHVASRETIRQEMQEAGYRLEGDHGFLPRQSFLVFSKGAG